MLTDWTGLDWTDGLTDWRLTSWRTDVTLRLLRCNGWWPPCRDTWPGYLVWIRGRD